MTLLSPQLLASRRGLDHRILAEMAGPGLEVEAFASARDLAAGKRALPVGTTTPPLAYRVRIEVPTLVGPESWADATTVTINTEVPGYPHTEPVVTAVGRPVPWSPHWHPESGRFCMGEFWKIHQGKALIGDLIGHIARLLNWDETLDKGYVGWNRAAVAHYWARGAGPLVVGQRYPTVPRHLLQGQAKAAFVRRADEAPAVAFSLRGRR